MFANALQDIRFGLRLLARSPGITINALLTLGLAIGVNSAVFSVVNSVLLRPLPYRNPERLAMIWETNPHKSQQPERPAWRNVYSWRQQSATFEKIAAFSLFNEIYLGETAAQRLIGCRVTSDLFPMLGVAPHMGRPFAPEDEALPAGRRVVILSDRFWRRAFGADPNIVGKPIRFASNVFTIAGVMPADFHFPSKAITPGWGYLSGEAEIFEPLVLQPHSQLGKAHTQLVIGRLKDGVTFDRASAEMRLLARRLEQEYPDTNTGWSAVAQPMTEQVVGGARPALRVFAGAVVFVLLIACANVAGLLLVRNAGRQKELAVRRAMGAGEARLLRQLLAESLLIGVAGGAVGLALAYGAVHALVSISPEGLPRLEEIRLDGRALGFTLLLSVATGLLCGLAPALQSRRAAPADVLKSEGRGPLASRGRIRGQQILVAGEIAISMALLAGAGLLLRSFLRLQSVDPGFRTENVLNFQINASASVYPTGDQIAELFARVRERIAAMPGVRAVGAANAPPFTSLTTPFPLAIEGRPETLSNPRTMVSLFGVTPGYFAAMTIRLERGRFISEEDRRGLPMTAVISRTLAERFWPGQDPIGKKIRVESGAVNPWMTIAGVAGDVRFQGLDSGPSLAVYHAAEQQTWRAMAFAVRTEGAPEGLIPAIRREIAAIDRELPVFNFEPVETMRDHSIATPRFQALLIGLFAAVAMAMAMVGAYGVMSYSVGQRTQEIGVRMALGAAPGDVMRMVLREGLVIALIGGAVGLAGALACGRLIEGFLFQTPPADFVTLAAITVAMMGAALLASYAPARRATRVDPMTALREN